MHRNKAVCRDYVMVLKEVKTPPKLMGMTVSFEGARFTF